ncbi:hypothetical protein SprV_0702376700 [Sparganum proliferum]
MSRGPFEDRNCNPGQDVETNSGRDSVINLATSDPPTPFPSHLLLQSPQSRFEIARMHNYAPFRLCPSNLSMHNLGTRRDMCTDLNSLTHTLEIPVIMAWISSNCTPPTNYCLNCGKQSQPICVIFTLRESGMWAINLVFL